MFDDIDDLLNELDALDELDDLDDDDEETEAEGETASGDPLATLGALDDDEEDDEDAELIGSTEVSCPYCGAMNHFVVDAGGGGLQEYVEDCQVCCQPCAVRLQLIDGVPFVQVEPLEGE